MTADLSDEIACEMKVSGQLGDAKEERGENRGHLF